MLMGRVARRSHRERRLTEKALALTEEKRLQLRQRGSRRKRKQDGGAKDKHNLKTAVSGNAFFTGPDAISRDLLQQQFQSAHPPPYTVSVIDHAPQCIETSRSDPPAFPIEDLSFSFEPIEIKPRTNRYLSVTHKGQKLGTLCFYYADHVAIIKSIEVHKTFEDQSLCDEVFDRLQGVIRRINDYLHAHVHESH